MKVLIVSKTKMKGGKHCVGGLTERGEAIRLFSRDGAWPTATQYDIGQVWDLEYHRKDPVEPPHVEDVCVVGESYLRPMNGSMLSTLGRLQVPICKGGPNKLFDGKLRDTSNKSLYIAKPNVPNRSVEFWIPDNDLEMDVGQDGKIYYRYDSRSKEEKASHDDNPFLSMMMNSLRERIPYIGLVEPAPGVLPAGTLLRISLARWWSGNPSSEERCYLQLSGWYDLP
jgi:hypothetical protein